MNEILHWKRIFPLRRLSVFMPLSDFFRKIESLTTVSAWTWIALIYAGQAVGSLFVAKLYRIDLKELAFSISLLFMGAFIAWIFRASERRNRLNPWHWWVPGILYAAFIFSLSQRSFSNVSLSFNASLFHPLEYFTLGIFLCWGWYPILKKRGRLNFASRVLAAGILWGVSDEIHQAFVPGRTPSFVDLSLDLLGLSMGIVIFLTTAYIQKKIKQEAVALN